MLWPETVDDLFSRGRKTRLGEQQAKQGEDLSPHLAAFNAVRSHKNPDATQVLNEPSIRELARQFIAWPGAETTPRATSGLPKPRDICKLANLLQDPSRGLGKGRSAALQKTSRRRPPSPRALSCLLRNGFPGALIEVGKTPHQRLRQHAEDHRAVFGRSQDVWGRVFPMVYESCQRVPI